MIAKLKGLLDSTGIDHAIIDVGGVGYLVGASSRTLAALGPVGEAVTIHTEMLVAEDMIRLVGFARADERDWYRLLTHVQGVGSRVALAILSALEPQELHRAVATGDKAMIARANGVGPKLAQRIVNELKDKIGAAPVGGPVGTGGVVPLPAGSLSADALSALQNLGFKPHEASAAVAAAEADLGEEASLDALVRLALRKAAK
ncbi:Holliday junction DNA helicase RuvA [Sphingobium sp. C100]|jgi:Holliday junction DNA helicase RuvA|uniref:Holliday junction branch migration protein RuvA n=1 Tax=Sphingobium sp. C100 TaxID=1207055 RepID=UPI0003D5DBE0|nr:Holliday junction branch migration protein RuvA [Sphingobium sp. C100]ETI65318.1 Holliday junction DNA helicase RuvA [Sphingobium sp. C100]